MIAFLLLACSDYGLSEKREEAEPGGTPDISVSPTEIDQIYCGAGEEAVTITNLGDGDLTVSGVVLDGSGWTVEAVSLPAVLAPEATLALSLEAGEGSANLTIQSDDPETPTWTVPLTAAADAPPSATLQAPTPDEILSVGSDYTLVATVTDDVDPAPALGIVWASDVDGLIGTDAADSAGLVEQIWPFLGRTPGSHTLSLSVTDSCGNTVEVDRAVCQQAGYDVENLDISTWNFEGVANWDTTNAWLELTDASTNVVGTAFNTSQTVDGAAVSVDFLFYIGGGTGADGLSLTVIDADRMSVFLGGTGCGIGYGGDAGCTGGPALPGWSVEVDTYYNDGYDPTSEDHLMFTFDGDVDDPAVWEALPEIEDAGWHEMSVLVEAPRVTVAIDGVDYVDTELEGAFDFEVYVGFTAGTGSLTNAHLIDALLVTEYTCEE